MTIQIGLVHRCKLSTPRAGGKFSDIKKFFEEYPNLIEICDYVWTFEDDVLLPYSSLVKARSLLEKYRFKLAAPSLSFESFFGWPIAVQNERMLFRGTDFVEIMAPIMSRDFLRLALPHFDENFSSWGYGAMSGSGANC
jgi:hypothetical protein